MRRKSQKERFLQRFSGISARLPLRLLIRLSGQYDILPFYHVVSDAYLPHVKSLYSYPSVKQFRRDLNFLLKFFRPASVDTFIKTNTRASGKCRFLLGFDDGLREIMHSVVPVLKEKGIPAVFFVNTGFVDNRALFFKHKAALLYDKWRSLTNPPSQQIQQKLAAYGIKSTDFVPETLLEISYAQRHVLSELAPLLEVNFGEFLEKQRPYLTWNEIRKLHQEGFEIGTHTRYHPFMPDLPLQEQLAEVQRAGHDLQKHIPVSRHLFSFPFTDEGISHSFFRKLQQPANGYADFTFACAGLKRQRYHNHFQRIPMEVQGLSARKIIHGEYAYFLLKTPLGRNRVKRNAHGN